MKRVTIYTTTICPYCVKAKILLDQKKAHYTEINVESNDELRAKMTEKAGGRRTVPQIFIEELHIGGCDDLYALEAKGELDGLLN
jgi:glutaredoxin 3